MIVFTYEYNQSPDNCGPWGSMTNFSTPGPQNVTTIPPQKSRLGMGWQSCALMDNQQTFLQLSLKAPHDQRLPIGISACLARAMPHRIGRHRDVSSKLRHRNCVRLGLKQGNSFEASIVWPPQGVVQLCHQFSMTFLKCFQSCIVKTKQKYRMKVSKDFNK